MSTEFTEEAIRSEVFAIIARQAKLDVATLKPELTLKDLGIASLTAIEVIFDLEEHFDVDFPEQGADFDSGTLQHLIDAIREGLAAKAAKLARRSAQA
jgi:acyl carrier protein